jgi:hypothetical protein
LNLIISLIYAPIVLFSLKYFDIKIAFKEIQTNFKNL